MKPLIQFKPTTPPVRKPISPVSAGFLILLLLACFGLAPMAQAVGPDTDGSIPGSNNGEGVGVLVNRTTGVWNSGTGFEALNHLTAGNQNTATGLRALTNDTNGGFNTATGVFSLFSNTSGFFNVGTGAYSLANNISGTSNTATGYAALYRNTSDYNTATGFAALNSNTGGFQNTANGDYALFSNTTGTANTATGFAALRNNTTSTANTATGDAALFSNTTGNNNTAIGASALGSNIADGNTAVGTLALFNNTTGFLNIALGAGAGQSLTTGNHNIDIGNAGVAGDGNTIRIGGDNQGATFIAGVYGVSVAGLGVAMNSSGQLGTVGSSRRFKKDIKAMEQASETVLSLKPVTFHYRKEIDPKGIPQFGLVAEEVEKVNPDLVVRDKEGRPYSVRYDQVNAMLLNEFLKEHRKVEEQAAIITELKSTVAQQQKSFQSKLAEQETQIEALASGLRKVSAQIETTNPAQKVAVNNP